MYFGVFADTKEEKERSGRNRAISARPTEIGCCNIADQRSKKWSENDGGRYSRGICSRGKRHSTRHVWNIHGERSARALALLSGYIRTFDRRLDTLKEITITEELETAENKTRTLTHIFKYCYSTPRSRDIRAESIQISGQCTW